MRAHVSNPHAFRFGEATWREDGTCSYCGSMTIDKALELLQTPGTHYSGSDWKYGWPHKFYIGSGKLYADHFIDATPEQLVKWDDIGFRLLGVRYEITEKGALAYAARTRSYQTWGDVK